MVIKTKVRECGRKYILRDTNVGKESETKLRKTGKQERQCTYNVTLRPVRATTVAVGKQ
jgi:hypothetical protein